MHTLERVATSNGRLTGYGRDAFTWTRVFRSAKGGTVQGTLGAANGNLRHDIRKFLLKRFKAEHELGRDISAPLGDGVLQHTDAIEQAAAGNFERAVIEHRE